ncbi:uncharacterized protein PFL1_00326 [Pseudozyma flocculosa PF-1]|nr:uncharacterized protein PFL1_00326 [Pseudozyma flocculosa PF-1]EPQ32129.1 hypothetical protein PFL1_00326 [Pseudozyma flocculosa PF-1]
MSTDQPHLYWRSPIGFGPTPSPRQKPDGGRFDYNDAETLIADVICKVPIALVQDLLPPDFVALAQNGEAITTVTIQVMRLSNLPWLAGRGYDTLGVYFNNVAYRPAADASDPGAEISAQSGSFLAVLFENLCDPIVTGREELGFPKVFADLAGGFARSEETDEETTFNFTASTFAHDFLTLSIPGLTAVPPSTPSPLFDAANETRHHSRDETLTHRFVPAVGAPKRGREPDADYAVFVGPAPVPPLLKQHWQSDQLDGVDVRVRPASFQQAPTLHHIIGGLDTLDLGT